MTRMTRATVQIQGFTHRFRFGSPLMVITTAQHLWGKMKVRNFFFMIAILFAFISCGGEGLGDAQGVQFTADVTEPVADSPESMAAGSGAWVIGKFFNDWQVNHTSNIKTAGIDEIVFSMQDTDGKTGLAKSFEGWDCSEHDLQASSGSFECHRTLTSQNQGSIAIDLHVDFQRDALIKYEARLEYAYRLMKSIGHDRCGREVQFEGNMACAFAERVRLVSGKEKHTLNGTCETSANDGGSLEIIVAGERHSLAFLLDRKCESLDPQGPMKCEISGFVVVDGLNYEYGRLREFHYDECHDAK